MYLHIGLIDTPGKSLFTYQSEQSWATYYNPFFQPSFKPTFEGREQELAAVELCGEDVFCLFDIAATGNSKIGLSTLQTSQQLEKFVQLTTPSEDSHYNIYTSIIISN